MKISEISELSFSDIKRIRKTPIIINEEMDITVMPSEIFAMWKQMSKYYTKSSVQPKQAAITTLQYKIDLEKQKSKTQDIKAVEQDLSFNYHD